GFRNKVVPVRNLLQALGYWPKSLRSCGIQPLYNSINPEFAEFVLPISKLQIGAPDRSVVDTRDVCESSGSKCQGDGQADPTKIDDNDLRTLYTLGYFIGRSPLNGPK